MSRVGETSQDSAEPAGALAEAFGMTQQAFLERFGQFQQFDAEDLQEDQEGIAWWYSGHPAQVLLGVDRGGRMWLAEPRLSFEGPRPVIIPIRVTPIDVGHGAAELVKAAAVRTRRRFRYCPQCRVAAPPEAYNTGIGVCDDCAARRGAVF